MALLPPIPPLSGEPAGNNYEALWRDQIRLNNQLIERLHSAEQDIAALRERD